MKNEIATIDTNFLSSISNSEVTNIVARRLPALIAKTAAFDRSNSQTTLNMMTLTMLNGQSPMRQVRQILAEIEQRQLALSESQIRHAEILETLNNFDKSPVGIAKHRHAKVSLLHLENKINGAIKDIATLIKTYDSLTKKYGIEDWTEEQFEQAESLHHIRRGFELLYRNIVEQARASDSTIEYLQQFGVHIQLAFHEVLGYINVVEELIRSGNRPTASHLEDFLDEMAKKYEHCASIASDRMFGTKHTFTREVISDRSTNDTV